MPDTQSSAAELLPQFLNDEGILNGEGSIAVIKPDKTTARIFLRQGQVYAVDNLEYEHHLWTGLSFEELISHGNLKSLIRAHKSQRDSLYKLLKRTRNKLKDETELASSLEEYVLGAIDDIYSWDSVKVEWRMGDDFGYDSAEVTPFSLQRMIALCVNRSIFKLKKYEEWGFKNDDQFKYGDVRLGKVDNSVAPSSQLEETILLAGKFIIKGLVSNTGFSLYTIISALDDLSHRVEISVENPSGRHKPATLPPIPADVPIIKDKVHFTETDEDPNMLKDFNTEYHVPEPALLKDTEETFNSEHKIETDDITDEIFKSYDDVINDTSSMEIVEGNLPVLLRDKPDPSKARQAIPEDALEKENRADDLHDLYKLMAKEVPKSKGAVKKPVARQVSEPAVPSLDKVERTTIEETPVVSESNSSATNESVPEAILENINSEIEGLEMPNDTSLLSLLEQLDTQLSLQKNKIEDHRRNIAVKESSLDAAKKEVNRLTMELANEIGAMEIASNEYEKARHIINSLNN